MRHGDEQAQVAEWVYGLLSTDPVLAELAGVTPEDFHTRVWPDVAKSGTPAPWLVYAVGEALDRVVLGPHPRVSTGVPLTVRWVEQSDDPGAGADANRRLYALLHRGDLNAPVSGGGTILSCRRTIALSYGEDAGGIQYRHVGGQFLVEVN